MSDHVEAARRNVLARQAEYEAHAMADQRAEELITESSLAPWVDEGEMYEYKFDEQQHRVYAKRMERFKNATVVIRYGDHPLIRELYPENKWQWRTARSEVWITQRTV